MKALKSFTSMRCWPISILFASSLLGLVSASNPPSSTFIYNSGTDNLTLSINVPSNSSDELFFHFSAPSSNSWAAFGFGNQMHGALIFVVYKSQNGQSVTVSPRLGQAHAEPQYTDTVTVDLFPGSGIINNNTMNVNGMCSNCRIWSGGILDTTSTNANMIWALGPVENIASNDLTTHISQHQTHGNFDMNLVQATGAGGIPSSTTTSSGSSDQTMFWDRPGVGWHAMLMIASFLIIFPCGVLFMKLFERVWLHLTIQTIGALAVTAGAIGGIVVSKKYPIHPQMNTPHQILGLIIFCLVLGTWTIGLISHLIFRRTGKPARLMVGHRTIGPIVLGLGLANVCVGFHLAGHNKAIIGFVLLTVLMILIVSSAIIIKRRRAVRRAAMNTPAAANFREGQAQMGEREGPPPAYSNPPVHLEPLRKPGTRVYR